MKYIRGLERNLRVSLFISVLTLICFLALSYFFYINLYEVPLGVLLGGIIMSLLHLLNHVLIRLDIRNGTIKFTLISIIVRYFILVGSIILLGFAYYYWNFKYFNLYAFVGAYTLGFLVLIIDYLIFKNED